jgi:hypothetical protein
MGTEPENAVIRDVGVTSEAADQDDELPWTHDAIPKNAIWLTDAFHEVLGALRTTLTRFRALWMAFSSTRAGPKLWKKSREFEKTVGHDPETFDAELEEEWHHRKQANLILRLAIEDQKLVACVRDPRNGETLQLHSQGWIPASWDEYVPPGLCHTWRRRPARAEGGVHWGTLSSNFFLVRWVSGLAWESFLQRCPWWKSFVTCSSWKIRKNKITCGDGGDNRDLA